MYEARKRIQEYRQLCKERIEVALEAYLRAQEAQRAEENSGEDPQEAGEETEKEE